MGKYNKVMMETAIAWSKMSYCKKKQVGCVVAKDNRIICTGYNGTLSGMDNVCEVRGIKCKCGEIMGENTFINIHESNVFTLCKKCGQDHVFTYTSFNDLIKDYTNEFVVHAEQNALSFAAAKGIKVKGCTLYTTLSPCKTCAKLIAAAGIVRVVYLDKYKDLSGIEFLNKCNIRVCRVILDKGEL
jgi:dCMP deaminase